MSDRVAVGSLADLLLQSGLITAEQLAEANRRRREQEKTLGRVLVEMGAIDEAKKLSLLKQKFGYEVVSIQDFRVDPRIIRLLPRSFCERHMVVPILREKNTIVLAMEDPSDVLIMDEARGLSGIEIRPVIAACQEIIGALREYPSRDDAAAEMAALPKPPFWYRALRYCAFPILCFLPIPVFLLVLWKVDSLQTVLRRMDKFDLGLYTFLLWGLWAVSLYYINGLVFPPPSEEE